MSDWLDAPTSSNKLKQSYFQNFVDVSGVVSIRNSNNLNLYKEGSTPEFSINSEEIRVNDSGIYYDISNSKLRHIKDLSENVQTRLDHLNTKTKYITTTSIDDDTMISMDNDNNKVTFHSSVEISNNLIALSDLSLNGSISVDGDASFNNRVDVCGNFYAQYPIATIPPTAIQGVGTEDGKILVSVYTSDEIRFDDDDFVIVKEDDDKIQITPYGIFVSENVIFDENDSFALFKENHTPKIEQSLSLTMNLSVSGEAVFDGSINIPTVSVDVSSNHAASCAYVQNQNYIISSTLMKQF
jgi:hypothetical protein